MRRYALTGLALSVVAAMLLWPAAGRAQGASARELGPGAVERVLRIAAEDAADATASADSTRRAAAPSGGAAAAGSSAPHAPRNGEARTMGGAIGGIGGLVVGIAAQQGVKGGEPVLGMDYYAAPIVTTAVGVVIGVAIGSLFGAR